MDLLTPRRSPSSTLPLHTQKQCTARGSSWGSSIPVSDHWRLLHAPLGGGSPSLSSALWRQYTSKRTELVQYMTAQQYQKPFFSAHHNAKNKGACEWTKQQIYDKTTLTDNKDPLKHKFNIAIMLSRKKKCFCMYRYIGWVKTNKPTASDWCSASSAITEAWSLSFTRWHHFMT